MRNIWIKLENIKRKIKKILLIFSFIAFPNNFTAKEVVSKKEQKLKIGIISFGKMGGHYTTACAVKDSLQENSIKSEIINVFDDKFVNRFYKLLETRQGVLKIKVELQIMKFIANKMHLFSTIYNDYFFGIGKKIFSKISLKKDFIALLEGYDLLISTSPFVHNMIANEISIKQKRIPIICIPTDAFDFYKGLYIYNPNLFYFIYSKCQLETLKKLRCSHFKSIPGSLLRKEFWDIRKVSKADAKKKLGFNPNEPVIMASFGSVGNEKFFEIAKLLKDKQSIIMCAKNEKLKKKIEALGNTKHRVEGFLDAEDMANRMRAADVFAGKVGGSIIWEVIQCESIFLPLKEFIYIFEKENAKFLVENNLGKEVQKTKDLPKIVEQVLAEPAYSTYKKALAAIKNNAGQEMATIVKDMVNNYEEWQNRLWEKPLKLINNKKK